MRTLLLSLVLSATAAYGQRVVTPSDDGSGGLCGGRASRYFRAASSGGFGEFCSRLAASDKVGNWWCINGEGTQPAGSVALTADGTPYDSTQHLCGAWNSNWFDGLASYKTANAAEPTALTICGIFKPYGLSGFQSFLAHGDMGGSGSFVCYSTIGTAAWQCVSKNSAGTSIPTSSYVLQNETVVALCGSYGTADGIVRAYVDGTPLTPGAAQSPPELFDSSVPWAAGGVTSYRTYGVFLGAFMTETQLSPSRIAALSTVCQ